MYAQHTYIRRGRYPHNLPKEGKIPNVQSIPQLIISLVIDNSRFKKMLLDFDSWGWAGNSPFTAHIPV